MSEARKKANWPIVVGLVLAVVVVALGVYAWGYFAMHLAFGYDHLTFRYERHYDAQWKAQMYWPAAKVDSFLTGRQVDACTPPDSGLEVDDRDQVFP